MRPVLALVALAALAACTVDTEGAACAADTHCPAGQHCGYDRTCSKAAEACAGAICTQTECNGTTLRTCVPDAQGLCASLVDTECSQHQACNAVAATCDCVTGGCTAGVDSYCAASGELVTCASEAGTGCRYEAVSAACEPFRSCEPGGLTAATCECQPSPICTGAGASCAADALHLISCAQTSGCWHATAEVACDLGQTCVGEFPAGACACAPAGADVGQGCATADAVSCLGSQLLRCAPVVPGSACNAWRLAEDCASAGLVCSPAGGAACVCPALAGPPFVRFADSSAPRRAGLAVNGAQVPLCRHASLTAALAVAATGDTVKATGFVGTPVVFSEAALTVPAGVTLTTSEATPTPAYYVVKVQGAGAQGVQLEAGASIAGVTVRRGTDGPELGVRVVGASSAVGPSLQAVRVDDLGEGQAFVTGLRIEGTGVGVGDSVALEDVGIRGASGNGMEVAMDALDDTVAVARAVVESNGVGIKLIKGHLTLLNPMVRASAAEGINADIATINAARLTIQDGLIQRNGTVGLWFGKLAGLAMERTRVCGNAGSNRSLSGETRKVGGVFALGAAPALAALTFKGNRVDDNGGDQVFIGAGSGWDLSAPSCASGERNMVAGYFDAGSVGLSAIGAAVSAQNWEWATSSTPEPNVDTYGSQGGSVDATGPGGLFCLPVPPPPPVCPP